MSRSILKCTFPAALLRKTDMKLYEVEQNSRITIDWRPRLANNIYSAGVNAPNDKTTRDARG